MTNYRNLLTFSMALLLAATPLISSAKTKGLDLKVNAGLNVNHQEVETEDQDNDSDNKPEHFKIFGIARATSSATSTRENRENKKEEKASKKECLRAFGHLIAPGFIKTHGNVSFSEDCWLPFGIVKKLGRGTTTRATSTPDTLAPVISNLTVTTGTTTASIGWKTNENVTSSIFWGTTSPLDLSATTTASVSDNTWVKNHLVVIPGLTSSTTYRYVIRTSDKSGNVTTSAENSFTTK